MVNEELLRKVIDHIEHHNRWKQTTWGSLAPDMMTLDEDGWEIPRPDAFDAVPGYVYDEEEHALITLGVVMEGSCGTNFCFAGHTVLQAGDKILINKDTGDAVRCVDQQGTIHIIEDRAKQLLDLDDAQSSALFDGEAGDEDLEKYKRLVTKMTGVTFEEERANA